MALCRMAGNRQRVLGADPPFFYTIGNRRGLFETLFRWSGFFGSSLDVVSDLR